MLPNTLLETFLSLAPIHVKDKLAWAIKERTEEREEIYDSATPFTRKLLNHMYGDRATFVATLDAQVNKWEVDLVFYDRLMGHAQFMESMGERLNVTVTSDPPGLDIGAYLQYEIMSSS